MGVLEPAKTIWTLSETASWGIILSIILKIMSKPEKRGWHSRSSHYAFSRGKNNSPRIKMPDSVLLINRMTLASDFFHMCTSEQQQKNDNLLHRAGMSFKYDPRKNTRGNKNYADENVMHTCISNIYFPTTILSK